MSELSKTRNYVLTSFQFETLSNLRTILLFQRISPIMSLNFLYSKLHLRTSETRNELLTPSLAQFILL